MSQNQSKPPLPQMGCPQVAEPVATRWRVDRSNTSILLASLTSSPSP